MYSKYSKTYNGPAITADTYIFSTYFQSLTHIYDFNSKKGTFSIQCRKIRNFVPILWNFDILTFFRIIVSWKFLVEHPQFGENVKTLLFNYAPLLIADTYIYWTYFQLVTHTYDFTSEKVTSSIQLRKIGNFVLVLWNFEPFLDKYYWRLFCRISAIWRKHEDI